MAIEPSLNPGVPPIANGDALAGDLEIEISPAEIMETEDGGMLIDFTGVGEEEEIEFGANLAEHCDEQCLAEIASEVVSLCGSDKNSRKDWEETYVKGLDQLGLTIQDRTTPWPGACGVSHPVLTEAVVRFQAQTITEIFPNAGPVKTKIVGKKNEDKEQQAERVREYMNHLITEDMMEYRSETEKMLFNLPLAGSAFRKVYWDPSLGRPCSMFVPAEDLIVSYGSPSLEMSDRVTHILKKSQNEIRKLQVSGFYLDEDIGDDAPDSGTIQEKYDELTGDSPSYEKDSRHTLYEMHVDWDITGFEDTDESGEPTGIALPYVITVDRGSNQVLSIRRNWIEDDPYKKRREHFVHYEYLPGLGFYGFGLIHLIGGIAKSATSLLRQLVDAGTLSNLPGGLKARGLRIKGDDSPIMPGEFRDVDVPGGAIRDNITFLPYKEPSNVLYQLLQNIVEEGRRFASLTDMKIADMNQQAPVGTTLAIIERSMKVMNSIQARIHYAMKKEFRILTGIVRDYMPMGYEWEVEGGDILKAEDFDNRVDIIPVSDPNSSTMAQRIMQYQAALQLASTAPQIYNLSELHRQMLDVLGIEDAPDIVPVAEDVERLDPASENMNILKTDPVKAFIEQDHESHIQTHLSAAKDPKLLEIIQRSPKAKEIEAALAAHVIEHLGFKYRREIEKEIGVPLPPPGEPLPVDVETRLSSLVAEAADRLLQRDVAEEQMKKQMEQMKDPVLQNQQKELEIKEAQVQSKMQTDAARIAADMKKLQSKDEMDKERIEIERERVALQKQKQDADQMLRGMDSMLDFSVEKRKLDIEEKENQASEIKDGIELGLEQAKIVREAMDRKKKDSE
mgnify:CR=1 FL=1